METIKAKHEEVRIKKGELKLKRTIKAGTVIKDLYDDGNYYYRIDNFWVPVDFNDCRHPDFIEESK